jgi:hypothetical protein
VRFPEMALSVCISVEDSKILDRKVEWPSGVTNFIVLMLYIW